MAVENLELRKEWHEEALIRPCAWFESNVYFKTTETDAVGHKIVCLLGFIFLFLKQWFPKWGAGPLGAQE